MSLLWLARRPQWATATLAPRRRYLLSHNGPALDTSNQKFVTNNDRQLSALFNQFDTTKIKYAFGYGSGVFEQKGYDAVKPQIDVVHVVDLALQFHAANSSSHPNHYSALLLLGVLTVAAVQQYGAGVYFNPYVAMNDAEGNECMVKYGVVSTQTALTDICEWSTLYIAGRLQKPVKHLHGDDALRQANDVNLENAFKVALLLLLPDSGRTLVSARQIYEKIALLSYMGDPRMAVGGENPNKVKNIVSKQSDHFGTLYGRYFERAKRRGNLNTSGTNYELHMDRGSVALALATLPAQFRRRLLAGYTHKYARELARDEGARQILDGHALTVTSGPYLSVIATDRGLKRAIASTLLGTIAYPALVQSLKGVFTAGVVKSARYAWEKKRKSWSI